MTGISDEILVLYHGEMVAEGTPAAIQANPTVIKAYLGEPEAYEVRAAGHGALSDGAKAGSARSAGTLGAIEAVRGIDLISGRVTTAFSGRAPRCGRIFQRPATSRQMRLLRQGYDTLDGVLQPYSFYKVRLQIRRGDKYRLFWIAMPCLRIGDPLTSLRNVVKTDREDFDIVILYSQAQEVVESV